MGRKKGQSNKRIKKIDPYHKRCIWGKEDDNKNKNLPFVDDEKLSGTQKNFLQLIERSKEPSKKNSAKDKDKKGSEKKEKDSTDSAQPSKKRPRDDEEEMSATKKVKVEMLPGESFKSWQRRLNAQTRKSVMDLDEKKTLAPKRKQYLAQKKKDKKYKAFDKAQEEASPFQQLRDEVKFGDIVERPPQLRAKPRTRNQHANQNKLQSLLLTQQTDIK